MRVLLCPQHFLHYKSVKKSSRANQSEVNSPIWPKIELIRDCISALVARKFEEYRIKNEGAIVSTTFPHYKSMGAVGCRVNQSSNAICSKTLLILFPTPMMPHLITIGQLASEIFKFESVDDDYTISPLCEPTVQVSQKNGYGYSRLSTLNESYNLPLFRLYFFLPNRDRIRMHCIRNHLHAHGLPSSSFFEVSITKYRVLGIKCPKKKKCIFSKRYLNAFIARF